MTKNLGLNGGYYSAGLQQAHSTTPHEAPHSAGAHAPQSVPPPQAVAPPPVSAVSAAPPPGIPHGLVSKSVKLLPFINLLSYKKYNRKHLCKASF